jgi:hypothetical protein
MNIRNMNLIAFVKTPFAMEEEEMTKSYQLNQIVQ